MATERREYRAIGLPTFISVVGGLLTVIGYLYGSVRSAEGLSSQILEKMERRLDERIAVESRIHDKSHENINLRIDQTNNTLGELAGQLGTYTNLRILEKRKGAH